MAEGLDKYLEGMMEKLNATEVRAGFLGGSTYPDGTSVALVATRNEYGDPAHNQPPRPFFRNAIAEKKGEWTKAIERGLAAGHDARTVLEVVGAQIKGDVQESIATLTEPALSPVTLERRRNRKVMPNQSDKPLVDTRVMIGDVNYEVI
ncbi:tail completion or Neck1 protein [Pantoea phage PA-1]